MLAVLLLRRGEVVSRDRLIDELWGERAPASAVKTVQMYVSNLRKALGNGLLLTRGHGYVLQVVPGQVDADRVEALVREGRDALETGDSRRASERLREALALWRDPALVDFAYEPFAQARSPGWRKSEWRRWRIGSTPISHSGATRCSLVSLRCWCASTRSGSGCRRS